MAKVVFERLKNSTAEPNRNDGIAPSTTCVKIISFNNSSCFPSVRQAHSSVVKLSLKAVSVGMNKVYLVLVFPSNFFTRFKFLKKRSRVVVSSLVATTLEILTYGAGTITPSTSWTTPLRSSLSAETTSTQFWEQRVMEGEVMSSSEKMWRKVLAPRREDCSLRSAAKRLPGGGVRGKSEEAESP
jgi:hypothetical protein